MQLNLLSHEICKIFGNFDVNKQERLKWMLAEQALIVMMDSDVGREAEEYLRTHREPIEEIILFDEGQS